MMRFKGVAQSPEVAKERIINPPINLGNDDDCYFWKDHDGLRGRRPCNYNPEVKAKWADRNCMSGQSEIDCYHDFHSAEFEKCCRGEGDYRNLVNIYDKRQTCPAKWNPNSSSYSTYCKDYLHQEYCGADNATGNKQGDTCRTFANNNLGVSKYESSILPISNDKCLEILDTLTKVTNVRSAINDWLGEEKCFDDSMNTKNYKYTKPFFKKYVESLDQFLPDNAIAKDFCLNRDIFKAGVCNDKLELQCKDKRYQSRPECSCYHSMNDKGVGEANYLKENPNVKDFLKMKGGSALIKGVMIPICSLSSCRTNSWKTQKQLDESKDLCPSCIQVNYIGDDVNCANSGCTQTNNCTNIVKNYKKGEPEAEEPEEPKAEEPKAEEPEDSDESDVKDMCINVECKNGGVCEEGICDCGLIRTGDTCERLSILTILLIIVGVVVLATILLLLF
jgi:hypothetical protein